MGSLALWGAVGGAAKGAEKGILMRAESEAKEKQSSIDHDRQMALERFKQSGAIELEGMRQEGATGRVEIGEEGATERTRMGIQGNLDVEDLRGFNAENRQTIEQNWKSIENQLDRESAERRTNAQARGSMASSNNPLVRAYVDRYEARTLTEGEKNEYGIALWTEEMPMTYDKVDGTWYAQKGDKLFPAKGAKPDFSKLPTPNKEALDMLFSNPTQLESFFLQKFGYLPREFLLAKMNAGLNQVFNVGQPAQGAE